MTACPPDDSLRLYLNDSLPPDDAGPLTAHIDSCPHCQSRLDGITGASQMVDRFKPAIAAQAGVWSAATPQPSSPTQNTMMIGGDGSVPLVPRFDPVVPAIPGYVIEKEIGRGGMGVVYKALHKRLNRPAAVKMVLAGGLADPRVTQRFLFEAEVLARVQHPQVVQVYEVSMYNAPTGVSIPYLSMEYLDGGTLGDWSKGEPKPPREAAELIEGLARAVHAAHSQGVIHRDLKPANILRTSDGVFKVTDFGLAKMTAEAGEGLTGTGTIVGTPAYMAPEQAAGDKAVGPPADVYSLGALLFELLTGRPPFVGAEPMSVLLKVMRDQPPDARSLRREVPRELAAVAAKCLTKEPHRRYASAAELADDLKRFREDRPIRARAHGTAERVWYWAKRNPGAAFMLATLAVVLTAAFISAVTLWRRAEANAVAMTAARDTARTESEEAAKQRDEAAKQRDEAARLRKEADIRGSFLAFDQAENLCDSGQIDEGLRAFVRALELAERSEERDLARVIRMNISFWDAQLFPAGKTLQHSETAPLRATAFSPDGKWVVTAGDDQRVVIWEADTGKKVTELICPDTRSDLGALMMKLPVVGDYIELPDLRCVAVNADRTRIAVGLSSGAVVVWSPDSPKPLRTFPVASAKGKSSDVWSVVFAPDGTLWVGGDRAVLNKYDVEKGALKVAYRLPYDETSENSSVTVLRLAADGRRLFSGDRNGKAMEWDTATGAALTTWPLKGWVSDIAVTPDGRTVAACSTGSAALLRADGLTSPWQLNLSGAYASTIAISEDGRLLTLGDDDGRARVWDAATRVPVGGPLKVGLFSKRISVRPGGQEMLVPKDKAVRIQPIPTPSAVPMAASPKNNRTRALDFSPDGSTLAVAAGELRLLNPLNGKLTARPESTEEPLAARFFDGGTKVVLGYRGSWAVYDVTADSFHQYKVGTQYVTLIPQQPDAATATVYLAARFQKLKADGTNDGTVTLPTFLDFKRTPPQCACLSPDARSLRVTTFDTVHFSDTTTGKSERPGFGTTDEIRAMCQTADGGTLVLGLRDNTVQVVDVATGKARFDHPPRHAAAVTAVAVSPDGRTIFSASRDQSARFWDAGTGLALGPAIVHPDAVTAVAFSPKGDRVAAGTSVGRVATWPVPPPPDPAPLDALRDRYATQVGNTRTGK